MDFNSIAKKWQEKWDKSKIFEVKEDSKKKKYYVLEMYPYPSAYFLHMGHVRNYTIGDAYARFKRMQGFNVLYPMGYDSFGLPAETAAKKEGIHPRAYAERSIQKMMEYQKALGNSYDWNRTLSSHDPNYYHWNQFFFIKLFEKGLAYRKNAPVNFCESCQSVLANEEAEGGKCWRCESDVVKKDLAQWFLKITDYADRLLSDLDKIDWPEKIVTMQKNWIGKSLGTEILFDINGEKWPVFTTRPDTIYGVTFMVISAQHPRLLEITTKEHKQEMEAFVKKCQKAKSAEEMEKLEKDGIFTGSYAIIPANNERVPVYAGNFVVAEYGSGMIMAVPAHDERDFQFAKKYKIPIRTVIEDKTKIVTIEKSLKPEFYKQVEQFGKLVKRGKLCYIYTDKVYEVFKLAENKFQGAPWYIHSEGKFKKILLHSDKENKMFVWGNEKGLLDAKLFGRKIEIKEEELDFDEQREAFIDAGVAVNSDMFNGMNSRKAIDEITEYLVSKKSGRKTINYKIRDWMISRQRYWGTPIPVIYCDKCGVVPVPEKDLPVLLPEKVDFKAAGNPLSSCKEFVNAKCPKCGGHGRRETDTMGGFVDSSWYFLRYCDNKNKEKAFDHEKIKYWMPVDQYIGGAEHAVMHLLYARFFVKALNELGYVPFDEPFSKLFNQGILYKDGAKMSKSKGNVVYQTDISNKYGIDTARFFLMFMSAPDKLIEWSDQGIAGAFRFLNRVAGLCDKKTTLKMSRLTESKMHKTIRDVTKEIEEFQYNKALIQIMDYANHLNSLDEIGTEAIKNLALMLSPFTPHLSEEIWSILGENGFASVAKWPDYSESKIDEKLEFVEEMTETVIADIRKILELSKKEKATEIKIIISPEWKYELFKILKKEIESSREMKVLITKAMANNELTKYGAEISKIVSAIIKDPSKIPAMVLSQEEELSSIKSDCKKISGIFCAKVSVERTEESKEEKGKSAMPGRPAIVIE